MKKLFSIVCIALCLLFSSAATTTVRADDGDGHAPGYVCIETVDCPPNEAPPAPQQQQSETSRSTDEEAIDMLLIVLELVNALLS